MIEEKDIYKEVITVLAFFDEALIEKIPDEIFNGLKEVAADSEKEIYIDTNKSLEEQDISEESKNLISLIYYICIADKDEKKELFEIWTENEKKYQQVLNEKCEKNDVFNSKQLEYSQEDNSADSNVQICERKKENPWPKFKKIIKRAAKLGE